MKRAGELAQQRSAGPLFSVVRRPGINHLAVLLCYSLLTVVMTWPLALHFNGAIPGDAFDGWQNYWNLWWIRTALVERVQNPYLTDLLYFPTGVELYFHTLNPFNGLLTLPIQLTSGLVAAYNSVVLFSWVGGGYGAFLLALQVWHGEVGRQTPRLRYGAALIAGAVFTFAPVHMAHLLGHMQVMSLEWIPFYCLYLWRGIAGDANRSGWLRNGIMAGLFLALAGLCDWYFVLYLFFFTALVLLWRLVHDLWTGVRGGGTSHWWYKIRMLVICCIVFVALLGPILAPMVQRAINYSFMVRPAEDLFVLKASVADFFIPNRLHAFFRPQSFAWIGNQIAPVSERTIGIGYVALVLAALAIWYRWANSRFWLAALLFFGALALGPVWHWGNITWQHLPPQTGLVTNWTPFSVFNRLIPFMRISRSVSRYALMVQLCVSVLVAGGIYGIAVRYSGFARRSTFWMAGVLVVLLAEYWVVPYPISPPDTPTYYHELAKQARGAILNLPMNYDRPGYLLYQTVHGRPLTVAYISRDDPRTLTERLPILQHFRHLGPDIIVTDLERVGQTVLTDLGVEQVVLDRYKMPDGLERTYTTALAQGIFAGIPVEYEDDRLTVYTLAPVKELAAYPLLGAEHWGALENVGGMLTRRVGLEPADIEVRRASATARLRIRLQTMRQAGATIRDRTTGAVLAELPTSEGALDLFITMGDVAESVVEGIPTRIISLQANQPRGLRVNAIELIE